MIQSNERKTGTSAGDAQFTLLCVLTKYVNTTLNNKLNFYQIQRGGEKVSRETVIINGS